MGKSILIANRPVNKFVLGAIVTALSLGGYFFVRYGLAASSTLYLLPASQTVAQNEDLLVQVKVNTNEDSVNVVQANLSYPADKLQFVSVDAAGSGFDSSAESSGGSGSVKIGRYVSGANSKTQGDLLIATVKFKVLAASGPIAVSFSDGSAVYSAIDSANVLAAKNGATYNFAATVTPPPPPPAVEPPAVAPPISPPPAPPVSNADTQAPVVSLTAPTDGQTVSGNNLNLEATATDNLDVTKVEFLIDGSIIKTLTSPTGAMDCATPPGGTKGCGGGFYNLPWNTTTVSNGSHTIVVKAYDLAGNGPAVTPGVKINVNNAQTLAPPPAPPVAPPPPPPVAPPPAPVTATRTAPPPAPVYRYAPSYTPKTYSNPTQVASNTPSTTTNATPPPTAPQAPTSSTSSTPSTYSDTQVGPPVLTEPSPPSNSIFKPANIVTGLGVVLLLLAITMLIRFVLAKRALPSHQAHNDISTQAPPPSVVYPTNNAAQSQSVNEPSDHDIVS